MTTQPEAMRLADDLLRTWCLPLHAAELRRLHALNQELLEALQAILNISLMDNGHWAKNIEAEAHNAIAKATGEQA